MAQGRSETGLKSAPHKCIQGLTNHLRCIKNLLCIKIERSILDISQRSEYSHDPSAVFLMLILRKITVEDDLFNDEVPLQKFKCLDNDSR